MAGGLARFYMIMVMKVVRMGTRAVFLMGSAMRMTHSRNWLLSFDQMDVRTMIAMMLVEKGNKAFPRCSRVKEKFSTRTASRKCGAPPPCSRDPSHAPRRRRAGDLSRASIL
jgi:hypothetical protein